MTEARSTVTLRAPAVRAGARSGRPASPRGGAAFLAAASALVVVAVAASVSTGSWWIPHNDDWAFTKIAERFGLTGSTSLIGWNNMSVAGQVFVLGPLGASVLARHVFVLAGAVLFAGCCFWAVRERHGPRWAGLATLTVVVSGPFLLLATSFMTDLPAAGLMLASFLLGRRSVQRGSAAVLAVSLVLGLWAATVRDTAIIAPVVVLAEHVRLRRHAPLPGSRRVPSALLAALATGLAGGFLVFEVWRRSLSYGMNPAVRIDPVTGSVQVIALFFTVSTLVLPVLIVRAWRRWSLRSLAAGAVVFAVGIVVMSSGSRLLLGNYLTPRGSYSEAAIGWRTLWFTSPPYGLDLLALVAGILGAAVLADSSPRGRLDVMWTVYALGVTASLLAPALLGEGLFDRYVLPLLVPAFLLVLPAQGPGPDVRTASSPSTPVRRALAAGGTIMAVLVPASVSVSITLEALAHDAAQWRAAQDLTRSGASPTDVAAGLEWVGYHASGPAHEERRGRDRWFWVTSMFDGSRSCYLVSASPIPGARLMTTTTYPTYTWFGASPLYTYATDACRSVGAAP